MIARKNIKIFEEINHLNDVKDNFSQIKFLENTQISEDLLDEIYSNKFLAHYEDFERSLSNYESLLKEKRILTAQIKFNKHFENYK